MNILKGFVVFLITILIGIAVGTIAEYWEVNKYIKYVLMAAIITIFLRLLGYKNGSGRQV
ncbi:MULTISPECIES: hypothetical protein [Pseudomonas]|uniref:Uncharacterized protein n=1 Tax=Pseudomonas fluorescens TaxID=294 RepID=A0A166N3B7_PSEFL|nr:MULTISPECIES: hypothetical protein [Pseudomonas]KZN16661.1 hypothetical protein A1D17_11040 [Pseudomonas fluorescens]